MGFGVEGLSELERALGKAARSCKKEYGALLADVGELFLGKCAERAPKDSGKLAASFSDKNRILDVNGEILEAGTEYYVARMVEEGHKLVVKDRVAGNGRKRKKYVKRVVGFAPGKHYMKAALDDTEKELPEIAGRFLAGVARAAGLK